MNLKEKPFYLTDEEEKWVYETLNSLTLEEKVHQMFCFLGDSTTPEKLESIVKNGIGGILFRPVRPAAVIRADFEKFEKLSKLPILHAANLEEGGAGGASDGTYFSSQLGVAAATEKDCRNFARCCAYEGNLAGVNWTFSPVSDFDMNFRNPITNCRTLGSNPKVVIPFATKFVKEYQKYGFAACAKHYPGDGVDFRDQHLHPTYNSLSAKKWRSTYGRCYRSMIDAGLLSVMVGHIAQPAMEKEYDPDITLDKCMPGSLSKTLLTDVLRGELGFNGLICTDATIMGGYTMPMKREDAIPTSFASGIDMIVFTTDLEEDFGYVLKGIERGLLTEERVNECVTRILALKAKVCKPHKMVRFDCRKASAACADNAITLVKNNADILPISPEKYKTIRLALIGNDHCFDGSVTEMMEKALSKRGFKVEIYHPLDDDLHGTSRLPKDRLTLTMLHYPPASNQTTVRVMWCPKHALEIPRFVNEEDHIFISFANPYHLQDVPRTKVMINAYTATPETIEAAAAKICGESGFRGVSPVDPFCGLPDTQL